MTIRKALQTDISSLVELEKRCFRGDALDRRAFRRLATRAHALTLVAEIDSSIVAYVTLLFRKTTSIARLYSIAVESSYRKAGIARKLIYEAEKYALANHAIVMRLEIRTDNHASLNLFHSLGYRDFGRYLSYYDDGQNAIRLQKHLRPLEPENLRSVPYYRQTLNFTCGPASLIMAMRALDSDYDGTNRREELRIWREATTIFMTSGFGGCGPHGLALAAKRRGFSVEVFIYPESILFIDSVRNSEKKDVIELVQQDFEDELRENRVPVLVHNFTFSEIEDAIRQGGIAVILTTVWYLTSEKTPHWVTVTGYDSDFVWYHDPFVDTEMNISPEECMHIPMPRNDFERMCRYGRSGQKALLILYPKVKS